MKYSPVCSSSVPPVHQVVMSGSKGEGRGTLWLHQHRTSLIQTEVQQLKQSYLSNQQ